MLQAIPFSKAENRIAFAANHNVLFAVRLVNHHFLFHADKLFNHACFHYKGGIACFHYNSVDDGKGKRNLKAHGAAKARGAFNFQRAADCLDILDNHVHPDASSRNFSNLLVGGKAREGDKLVHFLIGISGIRFIIIQKPLFSRLCNNFFPVKPGAVVIDVGVNRDSRTGKLCGDVDFETCQDIASYITKTPGGVGPMTIACLMENTVECFLKRMDK